MLWCGFREVQIYFPPAAEGSGHAWPRVWASEPETLNF